MSSDTDSERTAYIATVEKPDTNIHIHALFKMAVEQKARFGEVAPASWSQQEISTSSQSTMPKVPRDTSRKN